MPRTLSLSLTPSGCAFSSAITTVSASLPCCIAAMCSGNLPPCTRHRQPWVVDVMHACKHCRGGVRKRRYGRGGGSGAAQAVRRGGRSRVSTARSAERDWVQQCAHIVLMFGPFRVRVQQRRHHRLRLLALLHCGDVQRQSAILHTSQAVTGRQT